MATNNFIEGNLLDKIRKGDMGPGLDPAAIFGQFRQMLQQNAANSAGYLSGAAGRAGGVPQGLAARVGAITAGANQQSAVKVSAAVSNFEQQRYQGAMDRFYRYWRDEQQLEAQEHAMWGSLAGGIAGMFTNLSTLDGMSGKGRPSGEGKP